MGNPQQVKYRNIGDFLEDLPESELNIVNYLREIILENAPECVEKLAYNVPFYYRHYRMCFIWPASIPWGSVNEGVALGFSYGAHISGLEVIPKQEVGRKIYYSIDEIDKQEVISLLNEAILLDEEIYKKRKKK
ncbi:DUF1801 domain-containing protein [Marivirga lumbricoides]|uniref:DUF1801 domain-containing protein n=1 Tax=Marivirga lumbricoides TaxID=1046115 RepID=A0A2T4DKC1_9BACT|nr:DUF1801 domain-containing protein [Marivirga lumbricoides]